MTPQSTLSPRIRSLAGRWFVVAVALLFAVAAAGSAVTYATYVAPGTTTDTRTVSSWETRGYYTYYALVTVNNSVYPVGTSLDGRSAFLKNVAPVLSGQHVFTYRASDSGTADVRTDLSLVYREVDAGDGTVYWSVSEPIDTVAATGVAPGESVVAPFEVDAVAAETDIGTIRDEIGRLPGRTDTEAVVRARTTVTGVVNGQRVSEVRTYELPVRFQAGLYAVDDPRIVTDAEAVTVPAVTTRTYGPVRTVGAPLLAGLALVALAAALLARRQGTFAVTDAERSWLDFAAAREEFDDWITTGALAADHADDPDVVVDSLRDLVDLAIDTDNRVVESAGDGRLFVRHAGDLYVYDPPADPRGRRSTADPAPASALASKETGTGGE